MLKLTVISARLWSAIRKFARLLAAEKPDTELQVRRIQSMERNIGLPVRAVVVGLLIYYLFFSPWFAETGDETGLVPDLVRAFVLGYVFLNLAGSILLILMRRLSFGFIRWVVFGLSLVDGIGLAALTAATGGFNSAIYWVVLALIIRNAVSVPVAVLQISLNLSVCGLYLLAGLLYRGISHLEEAAAAIRALLPVDVSAATGDTEPFLIRLFLLLLMTFCCYGVQMLYDRNLRTQEESREFRSRQEQLQTAGRLAAEIAHQLKNPLAIINNAAFNVQSTAGRNDPKLAQQIAIIREEVERSDQIITQLMGYAQLAEGMVERVSVVEELDRAVEQVFPAGARYPVQLARDYEPDLPPLLMHRSHLAAIFVNLLQNAREAINGSGHIAVTAARRGPVIRVTVEDDGPGVPPERREAVFKPYYTTREKGTGLGLAIVRHNIELYGGTVRVESGLGKGARFILEFPTRTTATAAS